MLWSYIKVISQKLSANVVDLARHQLDRRMAAKASRFLLFPKRHHKAWAPTRLE
jgi:hypothetical protein